MTVEAQQFTATANDLARKRSVHRALTAKIPAEKGQSAWELSHSRPHPNLGDNQVLIETSYVALNPFDWQGVAFKYGIGEEAKVMGRDGAGVIVDVGKEVKRFKQGDRVWFCANSSASGTGAFQEYSVHSASEIGHTPSHLTDEKAATLGTGLITAGVALFRTLGLSLDDLDPQRAAKQQQRARAPRAGADDAPWLLIWGGAGITGVYLIELARLLGYRVICSASPVNHEYVRSLGADVVLDRWSDPADLVKSIRKATNDNVRIAIDNVGGKTAALCHQVLRGSASWRKENDVSVDSDDDTTPGQLVPLAGSPKEITTSSSDGSDSDAVRKVDSLRISFSTTFYNHPEFSEALLDKFDKLLESESLTPARIRLVPGGLSGIERGLEDLRHGRVPGGYKLVARLSDTPDLGSLSGQAGGTKRSREEIELGNEEADGETQDDKSAEREEQTQAPSKKRTKTADASNGTVEAETVGSKRAKEEQPDDKIPPTAEANVQTTAQPPARSAIVA
ncbi:hypothetical protein I316_07311 [Kwoniella heveanensis BCC8398]|uniref:Enoyl reductase (ER) domain-containing protein n=1 Tax=Kwoniella heveanensis BCC8398 TaxID=1296120 RepID=A0A1B9GIW9_9TREE|nr:hypothetical protein I316_07311 [Kwoniella heveanensis BCC8398]